MKGCAATCLVQLLGWAAFSAAFYVYLDAKDRLDTEPRIVASLAGGLGVAIILGLARSIFELSRERRTLLGEQPEDGKWAAVSGRIQSMHALRAPLSGAAAVVYHYRIWRYEGLGKAGSQVMHFEGKALVPSTIATRHGSIRLLAMPLLDIAPAKIADADALANARQYIGETQFDAAAGRRTLEEEWTDDDGRYRSDKRLQPKRDVPLEQCRFEERHIAQGESVCAFGLYSRQRGGLVPHPNWAKQTRLMRGDAQHVADQLRARMFRYAFAIGGVGAAASVVFLL